MIKNCGLDCLNNKMLIRCKYLDFVIVFDMRKENVITSQAQNLGGASTAKPPIVW